MFGVILVKTICKISVGHGYLDSTLENNIRTLFLLRNIYIGTLFGWSLGVGAITRTMGAYFGG